MAVYKAPRFVEFVDELPKSNTGKVLWRELQRTGSARVMTMTVRYEVADGVATLTLDRPAQRNALDLTMRDGARAVRRAGASATARCARVVLTGAGGAFCAGGDLRGIRSAAARQRRLARAHEGRARLARAR